jgi:hypothetical protein
MTAAEKRVVREKASPDVWRGRIERWKASGLKAKEFAATENLSARSLSWWHWRLQRRSEVPASTAKRPGRRPGASQEAMSFVPVILRSAEPSPMELILPGEIRVRILPGFDESTLLRIVRTLGPR